jgi:N-methylhydantoinase B
VSHGEPGRLGACIINPGASDARSLPSRFSAVQLAQNDVIRLEKSGGGGIGPPDERSFERIVEDVADGYVSRAAALATYRVDPRRLDAAVAALEGAPS